MLLNLIAVFNFALTFLFTLPMLLYYGLWNLAGALVGSKSMRHYAVRCMVAPDQWWNAALRGEEDETVSSRLGRAIQSNHPKWGARWFAYVVNFIFLLVAGQKNHVLESIEKQYADGAPSDERWSFIKRAV